MRVYLYYIFGRVGGKIIAQGGYSTEGEANDVARSITDWDDNDWEIKRYKTIDLGRAKSLYRAEMSKSSGQLAPTLLPIRVRKTENKEYTKGIYD
jgi:hypothetical protein